MNSTISITALNQISLAGIMHIGEFEKMAGMYQRLMQWGHENGVIDTSNFKAITIYHDNPNVTQSEKVRYSACVTVTKEIQAEDEIRPVVVRGGIFVVGRFEIGGEFIARAWKNMSIWIMENGYEFRDAEYFEIYHNDHKTHPESKFIVDICIPIEKTERVKLEKSFDVNFSTSEKHPPKANMFLDYHQVVNYMKELRAFFHKEYNIEFTLGKINQGSKDYTYFSLTPDGLKKVKLKFVIIYNHMLNRFTICLSGQNKHIRKKYWEMFKESDWDKYHLAESIDNSLMIMDKTMVQNPVFTDLKSLSLQIEKESVDFMNELRELLE